MKEKLHPQLKPVRIVCTCGNIIETMSTMDEHLTVEICSACHPFFTGKQKLMDTARRVDRFKKKYANVQPKK